MVWAGFGAVLPYLPIFLQEQAHASVGLIGIIAAAYYVGTFSLSSFMGSLSDRVGRKPLLVSGVALFAVSSLLFTTTTRPGWFILFRFLEGVGAAAVTPTAQAFVADVTSEEKRSRAYGWLISAQFGGLVAGPPLAIALYSLGGGQGTRAFYAIFLFGAVAAALVAVALLADHQGTRARAPPARGRRPAAALPAAGHSSHRGVPDRRVHGQLRHGSVGSAVESLAAGARGIDGLHRPDVGGLQRRPCCSRSWAAGWPTGGTASC